MEQGVWSTIALVALLCGAAGVGVFVNTHLPEHHRSRDAIEMVTLAITLLVTFVAIVLGLLTTSVKTGYDLAYGARGSYAGQLAQLDRCLRDYGPETAKMRGQLRAYVAAVIASTWPGEPAPDGVVYPDVKHMPRTGEDTTLADLINDVGLKIDGLQPEDALHQNLAYACRVQFGDLMARRWQVIEGVRRSISAPFYWVLVFWLVILFACFGLRGPASRMSMIVIVLSALSVSLAVFVILEMDLPYGGVFGIPSTAMRNALADMMR